MNVRLSTLLLSILSLFFASAASARDAVHIEYEEVSCVGDNCTVRLKLLNQTREPISGVVLACVAQRGLRQVMGEKSVPVPQTLYPHQASVLRFGMDIPGSPTAPPDRVICSVGFE